MASVSVTKNKEPKLDFNDQSDAFDYCIAVIGIPGDIFIKKYPDIGWGWDMLPLRFGFKGDFFIISEED